MRLKSLAAAIAAMAFLSQPLRAEDAGPQLLRQESQEGGYSIELPLDWDVKTGLRGLDCAAFSPLRPEGAACLESVSIAVLDAKEAKSPSEAAAAFSAALKARGEGFSLTSEGPVSIGGCEGFRVECLYEVAGAKLKARGVFLRKKGGSKIWSVTFSCSPQEFARDKSLFDAVEASFKAL